MMKFVRSIILIGLLLGGVGSGALYAGENWQGVDDAVVNKIAREHGRSERKSLIDTGEGDLQLFVFLLAGTAGGFVAGYYWRVLLEGRRAEEKKPGA